MSSIVLKDAKVTINSVNLSAHIASVTLSTSADVVETSTFGTTKTKTRIHGLKDSSVTFEFHQDYDVAKVEATINASGVVGGDKVAVTVSPSSVTPGTVANPTYGFDVLISEWTPLSGSIGELSTVSVTWPITGAITKTAV